MRHLAINIFLLSVISFSSIFAGAAETTADTGCTFQDGKQISVRYNQASLTGKNELSSGKVWAPDNQPIVLFTQAELSAGGSDVPMGAYSVYIRGGKESWTLIVNKNVNAGSHYEAKQDLAHINMPLAELSQPQNQLNLAFGLLGPKQCNLRVYYGSYGTWAEFDEK